MAIHLRLLIGAMALGGVVACASIVGLDESDPSAAANSTDGGGSSGSTSGADPDSGIVNEAGVGISASVVTFQKVACNQPQTQKITITNDGASPAGIDVSLPPNPVFGIQDAPSGTLHLDVPAHGKGDFTVTAKSPVAGSNAADVLVKIGDEEHHIQVSLESLGGSLGFEPTNFNFGQVRLNTPSDPQKVTFRNDGTNKITVKGYSGAGNFAVTGLPDLPFDLEPGATLEKEVRMTAGATANAEPFTETLTPQVDGLCGDPPTLTLKGQRLDAPYTVNPGSLDFSDVSCGAAAPAAKTITFSNFTSEKKDVTIALKTGAPFAVAPASVSVDGTPNAQQPKSTTISVSVPNPPQVPQDYTDTLLVTVGGQVTEIPLHVRIRGALLEASPTTLSLKRNNGSGGSGKVTLTNKGNVSTCVQYSTTSNTFISETVECQRQWCGYGYCDVCGVRDNDDSVPAGTPVDWSVRYWNGTASSVTITANNVRCGGYGSTTAPLCGSAPKIVITGSN